MKDKIKKHNHKKRRSTIRADSIYDALTNLNENPLNFKFSRFRTLDMDKLCKMMRIYNNRNNFFKLYYCWQQNKTYFENRTSFQNIEVKTVEDLNCASSSIVESSCSKETEICKFAEIAEINFDLIDQSDTAASNGILLEFVDQTKAPLSKAPYPSCNLEQFIPKIITGNKKQLLPIKNISNKNRLNSEWSLKLSVKFSEDLLLLTNGEIRDLICRILVQTKIPCVLIFQTIHKISKKNQQIVVYGSCKDGLHNQNYKFEMANNIKEMRMFTLGPESEIIHSSEKVFRQYRGMRREKMKLTSDNKSAHNTYLDLVSATDLELYKNGNTQDMTTPDVLRKIKSEFYKKDDLVQDCDLVDIFFQCCMEPLENKYIYSVTEPLQVVLIRKQQLALLQHDGIKAIHFDATGGIVKIPTCHKEHKYKRILYYACVVKINFNIIPIAEFITCQHDAWSIGKFLVDLKKEMGTLKQLKEHYFVVDWSWALINAITNTFNNLSISRYIELNFNFLEKGTPLKKPVIPIFICCSHFVNIIIMQIKKKLPHISAEHRNLILDFFCAILSAKSVDCVDELFKLLCFIMCSPNITRSSKRGTKLL